MLVPVLKDARSEDGPRDSRGAVVATHSAEDRLTEATGLAEAIDLEIAGARVVTIATPRPATLFGKGKVEELRLLVEETGAGLVIVDHAITPVQQSNLEKAWNAKVLDRTGLILEIFGRRARTREGRLQVELAHLTYQKGRLVRAWTHLERQRGGGGFLGGPGEAQLELDRRILEARIESIKKELAQVVKTRELHRAGRRKVPYPIVAIVGYTNAGKSTLFNLVTGAAVLAKDQVFATLDPTMREVKLRSGRRIILSDTVGFISSLPTMLVAAFRATLEEVVEADLILHVRDISHAETDAQAADVEGVLGDLGIDTVRPTATFSKSGTRSIFCRPRCARMPATSPAFRNAARRLSQPSRGRAFPPFSTRSTPVSAPATRSSKSRCPRMPASCWPGSTPTPTCSRAKPTTSPAPRRSPCARRPKTKPASTRPS